MMAHPSVPIIDLSNFEKRQDEITDQIIRAAKEIGFLQVVNHGIDSALIDKMFAAAARFFALPTETKEACAPHNPALNVGWEANKQVRPSTGLPDVKESYQMGFVNMEGRWPSDEQCAWYQETAERFQRKCFHLARRLLAAFARGLGLAPDFFEEHHDPSKADSQLTLRALFYPPTDARGLSKDYFRAGSHTDFDTLTLLFQRLGQGGLQVCPGRQASTDYGVGDAWVDVPPVEDAITLNIGDLLMRWSGDQLVSNFHRVRMPLAQDADKPRYSIAFFTQPNRNSVVIDPTGKYPPITAGEYVERAVKPQYEAAKRWQEAQAAAARAGVQAAPIKVFTSQSALVA